MPTTTPTSEPVDDDAAARQKATALALDLRALADVADANPELAPCLAAALSELHVVLSPSSKILPEQIVVAATVAADAAEVEPHDVDEAWFPARAVKFTHGTIRLSVTILDPAGFALVRAGGAR